MESKHIHLHPPRVVIAALVLLLITGSLLAGIKALNEWKSSRFIGMESTQTSTLTVTGHGQILAKPDIADMTLNVSLTGTNLAEIQAENTSKTNALFQFLKGLKIEEKDIQTTSYSIDPQWDYADKGRTFRGFQIRNVLRVKIRDFTLIGTILTEAIQLGANDINFNFAFEEQETLRLQAREEAIENAKVDAKTLAKQLGVNLVRISSFSEGSIASDIAPLAAASSFALESKATPQVEAGESVLNAQVTIVYEIH